MKYSRTQLNLFQERVVKNFREHCSEHGMEATIQQFLDYSIANEIISPVTVRHYAIVSEYHVLMPKLKYRKSETVAEISKKLNISDDKVYSALREPRRNGLRPKIRIFNEV